MKQTENVFIFVVCGSREHIDTLHYSLRALKQHSKNEIIIVTDSTRNEIPVIHSNIIDIKTPEEFNHHEASIYLKTGLHKFLPVKNNYCYLDTDLIAVDNNVDEIFNHFTAPVVFANDHCLMDKFSPAAVKCNCIQQYKNWERELLALFKKYKHLKRQPENKEKKQKLLLYLNEIKKNRLKYFFVAIRFWFSPRKFKLYEDAILDKKKHMWVDMEGNAVLYENEDPAITSIENSTDYRCDKTDRHRWTIYGNDVFDCRCNHLQNLIFETFGIKITDSKWQHWNGGVFLFNEQSHAFLNSWHKKTVRIFKNSNWQTRDQGTLIATAWEFNLQNHTTLPAEFNLIADYNNKLITHRGNLCFDIGEKQKEVHPHFIHVYHQWGKKNWDVWRDVEKRTGIAFDPFEKQRTI